MRTSHSFVLTRDLTNRIAACMVFVAAVGGCINRQDYFESLQLGRVSLAPDVIVADSNMKAIITVEILDARGRPAPGVPIKLSAHGSAALVMTQPRPTDGNGMSTATVTASSPGTSAVSTSAIFQEKVLPVGTPLPITTIGQSPSILRSSLTATPLSLTADGQSVSRLELSLADSQSAPIRSAPISWSVQGGAILGVTSGVTDANGRFFNTLTSTHAGPTEVAVQTLQRRSIGLIFSTHNRMPRTSSEILCYETRPTLSLWPA